MSLFKSTVEDFIREQAVKFVKFLLSQAVKTQATKIVFGEPGETGCKRVPFVPTAERAYDAPWEKEDKERFAAQSKQAPLEERRSRKLKSWLQGLATIADSRLRSSLLELIENRPSHSDPIAGVPFWIKSGDTYTEFGSFPQSLYLPLLAALADWNGMTVRLTGNSASKGTKSPDLLLEEANRDALSRFMLLAEDGTSVHALLGFESNYCLSITIENAQK